MGLPSMYVRIRLFRKVWKLIVISMDDNSRISSSSRANNVIHCAYLLSSLLLSIIELRGNNRTLLLLNIESLSHSGCELCHRHIFY